MAELQIDPETLLRVLPCFETIQLTADAIRPWSITEDQVTAYLREKDREALPITIETALVEMQTFLDRRIKWWQ